MNDVTTAAKEQSVQPEPRAVRLLKSMLVGRGPVNHVVTTSEFCRMTHEERIARLNAELSGSDAQINGEFHVWALNASVTDAHLRRLASWADLEFLMVAGCPITDAGLASICCFRRLNSLDIGSTGISADAIANADFPTTITTFGLYDLPLTDEAVNRISRLTEIQMLNCNGCELSLSAFHRLAELPQLRGFEALGCPIPDDVAQAISRRRPNSLLRLDSGVWTNGVVKCPPTNMS